MAGGRPRQDRAAMYFFDQAVPGEDLEIAADGHIRDAEPLGKVTDTGAAIAPDGLQDERLAVSGKHYVLPLLHAGWRRGRAVASGLRHPYQLRRLRSVFGSGRACRNSWDFRTAVISATPRPAQSPFAAPGAAVGAASGAAPAAAQAARDSRPVTQGTHHRATPVCTVPPGPGYCSCRMLPSHAFVASRPSRPRHRLTRLISRPAPKPHLSPTSSCT